MITSSLIDEPIGRLVSPPCDVIFEKTTPPRYAARSHPQPMALLAKPLDTVPTPKGRHKRQPTSEQLLRLSHVLHRTTLRTQQRFVAKYSLAHINAHNPHFWNEIAQVTTAPWTHHLRNPRDHTRRLIPKRMGALNLPTSQTPSDGHRAAHLIWSIAGRFYSLAQALLVERANAATRRTSRSKFHDRSLYTQSPNLRHIRPRRPPACSTTMHRARCAIRTHPTARAYCAPAQ